MSFAAVGGWVGGSLLGGGAIGGALGSVAGGALGGWLTNEAGSGGGSGGGYGGGGNFELSPQERAARQQMITGGQALVGYNPAMMEAWQSSLQGGINPYTTSAIQAAQQDELQDYARYVLPRIRAGAQGAGGFGGGRQGVAEGLASEGLLESLGDISTGMLAQAYDTNEMNKMRALQMSPSIYEAYMSPYGSQVDAAAGFTAQQSNDPNVWASVLQGAGGGLQDYTRQNPDWANTTKWGTTRGSQQSDMLAEQEAGMGGNWLGSLFNGGASGAAAGRNTWLGW